MEKLGQGVPRRCVGEREWAEIADRLLSLAVFEEFHLAQALFGFGLALVGAAEILALFGKHFVAFFHFFDHFAPRIPILSSRAVCAMHGLLYLATTVP